MHERVKLIKQSSTRVACITSTLVNYILASAFLFYYKEALKQLNVPNYEFFDRACSNLFKKKVKNY